MIAEKHKLLVCHPYNGNLDSKTSGDSKYAFLPCEDVAGLVGKCHQYCVCLRKIHRCQGVCPLTDQLSGLSSNVYPTEVIS